jgi:hypothetical protein
VAIGIGFISHWESKGWQDNNMDAHAPAMRKMGDLKMDLEIMVIK